MPYIPEEKIETSNYTFILHIRIGFFVETSEHVNLKNGGIVKLVFVLTRKTIQQADKTELYPRT